ncbi:hypothetical protein DRP43_00365 [candidate division TA06 bacterium]|uniref:WD40 repeat domain-containing protein n=1 Tax=candidate division TA06 bacterium TaxID=2250710 RepID=A0A660SP55_UNCT6|nr:MAG: hypothetical protein DRP43_00365 [candidate division TA06 bacterium]
MKRLILILITLLFISPIVSSGAEKDSISLNLIWEKEFPEPVPGKVYGGIYDVAFDKNRGGLFCPTVVVTGNSENARGIIYFDSTGEVVKTRELKEWTQVRISSNGKYIAIMHPEKYDGEFHCGPVDIETILGKFVKRIDGVYSSWWWVSPKGNEIIEKDIWADADIYYFRGTIGKGKANLTKKEGDFTLFDGKPAIKWTGTENDYLQIGNKVVTASPDGKYVVISKYVPKGKSYVDHLLLYTKDGIFIEDFDLGIKGSLRREFSSDSRYLVASVENLVFLIDVEKRKILWRYKSDDIHQTLNLSTTIDFSLKPFYIVGVFHHHEHSGPKMYDERIIIFSMESKVMVDTLITKTLDRLGKVVLRVNSKGNMLCYVTPHKIRVFELWGVK